MASGHEPPERIENVVIFAIMQGNPSTTPSAQTDGLGSPLVSFACPPLGGPGDVHDMPGGGRGSESAPRL